MSITISGKINASSIKFSSLSPIIAYAGFNGVYRYNTSTNTFSTIVSLPINAQQTNNTLLSNGEYGVIITSPTTFYTAEKNWTNIKSGVYPSGSINASLNLIGKYFYQVVVNGSTFQLYRSYNAISWTPIGSAVSFSGGKPGTVYAMNNYICVGLLQSGTTTAGWYFDGSSWNKILTTSNITNYGRAVNGVYFNGSYYIPSGADPNYYSGSNISSLSSKSYNVTGIGRTGASGPYNYLTLDQFVVTGNTIVGLCCFTNLSSLTQSGNAYQIPFAAIKSTDGVNWTSIPINDTTGSMKWSRSTLNHILYTGADGSSNFVSDSLQSTPGINGNTYGYPNYYPYTMNNGVVSNNTSFFTLPLNELVTGICFNL